MALFGSKGFASWLLGMNVYQWCAPSGGTWFTGDVRAIKVNDDVRKRKPGPAMTPRCRRSLLVARGYLLPGTCPGTLG